MNQYHPNHYEVKLKFTDNNFRLDSCFLDLAEELGDLSSTCSFMNLSIDIFYIINLNDYRFKKLLAMSTIERIEPYL